MQNRKLIVMAFILLLVWGCKDDEPVDVSGVVSGKITDAHTDGAVGGVRMIVFKADAHQPVTSMTSDADGSYEVSLNAGNYYVKLYSNGYDQLPPKGMSPLPFTIVVGGELTRSYAMNPSQVQNGGFVKGRISEGSQAVPGALVVAEKDDHAYSAVSDAAGDYYIYNLPAGTYSIEAWMAGYSSTQESVSVNASAESLRNLALSKDAGGAVSGTLSFLASNATEVDISLVHPKTGEAIPGLHTRTSKDYIIEQVPAGNYIARASFQNDGRVVDPDWIVKNGEPLVTVSTGTVDRNFSLTGAVSLVAPSNLATTTEPVVITSSTPEFSWQAYSSSSDYVVELSDANGNVIWGGFRQGASGPEKKVSLPSSQTSVVFNFDQTATSALLPGRVYRWKVYASKEDNKETSGWKLISVSEDQMGLIQLAD